LRPPGGSRNAAAATARLALPRKQVRSLAVTVVFPRTVTVYEQLSRRRTRCRQRAWYSTRSNAPNANLNAGYGRHRDIVRALLKGRKVHRAKFGCFALFAKLGFGWRLRDVSTTRPQESESLRARRNLETHELPFFATALSARPQPSPSKVPTSISTFALEDIFSTSTLAKAVDNSNRGRLALIGTVNSALA
jgi:hypothetical protein